MKTHRLTLPFAIAAALALAACGDRQTEATADRTAATDSADVAASTPAYEDPAMAPSAMDDGSTADASGYDDGSAWNAADSAATGAGAITVSDERAALGVLNAINDHEIAAARQALERGVDGAVADYAQLMIDAHNENKQLTAALNPDSSDAAARAQAAKGQAKRSQLGADDGEAYERAYVQAMVEDHEAALKLLDEQLIPAAQSGDVRDHLTVTREHVAHHLEQARALVASQ